MKIRQGFVANSSSSSFLIYGTCLDTDTKDKDGNKINQYRTDIDKDLSISLHGRGDGYSGTYLGMSWDCVGDDETGSQFKARIEGEVKKFLGRDNIEFGTFEDGWFDG